MNIAAKILSAMRSNPLDWTIRDLQVIAARHGVSWRDTGGSHCIFIRPDERTLSVPARRPIKPIYIRKFVELIDGAHP